MYNLDDNNFDINIKAISISNKVSVTGEWSNSTNLSASNIDTNITLEGNTFLLMGAKI